jgi:hypothetical protein
MGQNHAMENPRPNIRIEMDVPKRRAFCKMKSRVCALLSRRSCGR